MVTTYKSAPCHTARNNLDLKYVQEEKNTAITKHVYVLHLKLNLPPISNKLYSIIILPVVLCGCETWSLTLRKECRLRMFENRVLRRIFGPKRNEVTGK
jgi:hypothetical protein